MEYTLIGHPHTRAMRVMWMLEEVGQPYTLIPAKPHQEAVVSRYPVGKVPALVVGETVLTDSAAICSYLADRFEAMTLTAGTVERGQQDAHLQFILDELDGTLWQASKHKFVLPPELRVEGVHATAHHEWKRGVKELERRLGDQPFLMGEAFTVPDLIAAHCLVWAISAKFDVESDLVMAYGKRCRSRPAFKAARARGAEEIGKIAS